MLERVWRKVSSPTLGGNVNWVQPLWRKHEGFLKKLKTELPYDPAIPLLSIYIQRKPQFKRIHTPQAEFIAELFIIAKTWKQPKCSSKDEWIKMMWYICTMEYYSAIKKNKIMPYAATWMDLEIIILNEGKSDRERQIII